MNVLAIRADGGAGIGAGHVMRCAALSDSWQRSGGEVTWFSTALPPLLTDVLTARGIAQRVLPAADAWHPLEVWVREHPGAWTVVDGYPLHEGPARVCAAGGRCLVVDDNADWPRYDCDVIVNQNPYAPALPYRANPGTVKLLGARFALLRDEMLGRSTPRPVERVVHRVLVSFGGHDTHGQAPRVARVLAEAKVAEEVIVVNGLVPGTPAAFGGKVRAHTSTDLSAVMAETDLAVVSAGSICWELAHHGVPFVAMTVADNQARIADSLAALGIGVSVGWFDRVTDEEILRTVTAIANDHARRAGMQEAGTRLVDGRGRDRVVEAMQAAVGEVRA